MRRGSAAAALAAVLAIVAAAPAEAATLTVAGTKSCYRAGDALIVTGSGFTPGGQASVTLDGQDLGVVPTDAAGNFTAPLNIGTLKGVRTRTLIATDAANPANVAQAQFLEGPDRQSGFASAQRRRGAVRGEVVIEERVVQIEQHAAYRCAHASRRKLNV